MKLSSELISQFVKITNDEPKKKNESTVYATAIDGSSVQIDGSDRVIPVESLTAVKLESGDRVTVQIKDHTAIVTGNLTDPSAKGSNVDTLGTTVAKALTVDDITAENGRIKTLLANHLTVDDIEAEDGRIAKLVAGFITSEELDVERGRIEKLEVGTAKIDTLIFGSASGDVIQTNFSNSVIAQLGDAQIKSAMIESISAGKITSGDIVTNNVRIVSEDNKMILKDGTLQISDGTNDRVQIGKDASGDYSINIWDQNGNLMFSKGGITDAAIKDAIIRNDMVSDTADIHASKLDIDSLFEEINEDGSNVIKSAKVKLDDKNLTLDVAFKQLEGNVSSQGAAISANTEAISTKVWQQDIDSIEVGGRNFILGSRDLNGTYSTNYDSKILLSNGFTAFKCTGNWHGVKRDAKDLILDSKDGDTFTFSLNIKTSDTCKLSFYAMCYMPDKQRVYPDCGSGQFNSITVVTTNSDEEQDQRARITFQVTQGWIDLINDGGTIDWTLQVHDGASTSNPAYLYAPKLERGDKATDWTPAPEDAESNISSLSTRATTLEQTAAGLTARITTAEGNITNASKTATDYLNFSSDGLIVGDMTADALGKNILIDTDSVDIRNGSKILASYGDDYIELAKESPDATIDLCNGLAKLYHTIDDGGYSIFNIDTTYGLSYIKMSAPMHDMLVLENTATTDCVMVKSMIHGTTVGGFAMKRDGYMVRCGADADEDNPVEYRIHDEENFGEIDSEWKYGGVLGEDFTLYDNDVQIEYRKIGKIVSIRGCIRPTTTIAGGTTNHLIFTLPVGYCPDKKYYQRCQGSGSYSWLLAVYEDGKAYFSRYNKGDTYADASTSTWLPFNATFFID